MAGRAPSRLNQIDQFQPGISHQKQTDSVFSPYIPHWCVPVLRIPHSWKVIDLSGQGERPDIMAAMAESLRADDGGKKKKWGKGGKEAGEQRVELMNQVHSRLGKCVLQNHKSPT